MQAATQCNYISGHFLIGSLQSIAKACSLFGLQEESEGKKQALEREKQMNRQIMQRKQEIEWQLMEALSQVCKIS